MTEKDVIRETVLQSTEVFTRYFFKKRENKKFIVSDHHRIIFNALERVISGESKRLIINIAPRYGKTEIAVKSFIAYGITLNPKAKFIHLSYADQLALDNSEEIKDLITSHEYQQIFPEVKIKKDSKAKNKWYTTEGGGVLARSATGQVTGFGAGITDEEEDFNDDLFGGAIVIDDPIKPEDADSQIVREKVNHRFDSTVRNRVNSRNTPIIIIMQRLHPEDLSGYLIDKEPDQWEVISLPAIKNFGTENEQALWPHKHTLDELKHLKKVNESVFLRQYMQDPQPREGLLFPKDELNFYNGDLNIDSVDAKLIAIDVADEGDDFFCQILAYLVGQRVYVHDVIFNTDALGAVGTNQNVDRSINMINQHKPEYVFLENNYGGSTLPAIMRPQLNGETSLITHKATTSKHQRIITESGFIKMWFYFRDDNPTPEYDAFMANVTGYDKKGAAKHDDAPDCLQILSVKLKNYYYGTWDDVQI